MKTRLICGYLTFCIIVISTGKLIADGVTQKEMKTLPAEVVIDKIRGGLLGQILGDLNGLPHEGRYRNTPGMLKITYHPYLKVPGQMMILISNGFISVKCRRAGMHLYLRMSLPHSGRSV